MKNQNQDLSVWLAELRASGKAIIVEGPKDKAALEHFGIPVAAVLSEQPLFAIAEEIAERNRHVIILTDLDAEGRKLYGKLVPLLKRLGVTIDTRFREFLLKETTLSHIEGLVRYAETVGA